MMKKSRHVAIPVVLLITLLLSTSVVNAASSWSIVTSPSPGFSINILKATAAISKSDVWAVGSADLAGVSGLNQALTEHWNGTSWKTVKSPDAGTQSKNFLNGVAAVSTSNVWAVGYYFNAATEQTLIEHWNGTSWKMVKSPNVGTENSVLQGVAASSANDVWAVGYYLDSSNIPHTLTEHWNGTSWSIVTSPNNTTGINVLQGVAAVSTSDVWAVGYAYPAGISQTLIEQWNGTNWSIVPSPNNGTHNGKPSSNQLNGVAVVSASDIWTVGYYQNPSSGGWQTLIEQWNGTSWSIIGSPNVGTFPIANYLNGVVAVSASDVWAVGDEGDFCNGSTVKTLIEQWNGTSWNIVTSPNGGTSGDNLYAAAAIDASHVWAVGAYATNGGDGSSDNKTLIESY